MFRNTNYLQMWQIAGHIDYLDLRPCNDLQPSLCMNQWATWQFLEQYFISLHAEQRLRSVSAPRLEQLEQKQNKFCSLSLVELSSSLSSWAVCANCFKARNSGLFIWKSLVSLSISLLHLTLSISWHSLVLSGSETGCPGSETGSLGSWPAPPGSSWSTASVWLVFSGRVWMCRVPDSPCWLCCRTGGAGGTSLGLEACFAFRKWRNRFRLSLSLAFVDGDFFFLGSLLDGTSAVSTVSVGVAKEPFPGMHPFMREFWLLAGMVRTKKGHPYSFGYSKRIGADLAPKVRSHRR